MDTLNKSKLATLTEFLQQQQQEFLSCWLEEVSRFNQAPLSSGHKSYWQHLIDFYYPGVLKSIIGQQSDQLAEDIKKALRKGQLAGIPYRHIIESHFVFRDIITNKINSQKEKLGVGQDQINLFIDIIHRVIDKQVVRIGEFYIQVLIEELTDSKIKQQSLSYRIPEIIYSYSPQEGFTFVSHALERLLGFGSDKLYHRDFSFWVNYVHPQDQKKVLSRFKQQLKDKKEAEYEYRMLPQDKTQLLCVVNRSAAMLDEAGNLTSIDGIIIDITQMKKMEHQLRMRNRQLELMTEELRKANKRLMEIDQRKSDLVNIVAHDLRNPLNSIRIFTELLLMYKNSPAEQEEFLHKIDQESMRLIDLIDNFLDIEKIEAGRVHYKRQPVNLTELIEHFVSVYHWETEMKGISLTAEYIDNIPTVIGDQHRLSQVFSNLLANAIRFTPRGGNIYIKVKKVIGTRKLDQQHSASGEQPPKYIKISIQDSGPGIERKYHKKVFDKFYQIRSQDTAKKGGTGLGLAIAKEIVEHQGGRIWVESGEGKGATFFFTLPIEKVLEEH
jgi:PAS domain S-box-containing protein